MRDIETATEIQSSRHSSLNKDMCVFVHNYNSCTVGCVLAVFHFVCVFVFVVPCALYPI